MLLSVQRRNFFLSFRKRKTVYKYIFYLFNLIGIFKPFNTDNRIQKKIVHCILVTTVTIIFIIISSSELRLCFSRILELREKYKKTSFIGACLCLIYILFRISLNKSFFSLTKIANVVCRISSKIRNKCIVPLWIYVWIIVVLLSLIFAVFLTTFDIYSHNDLISTLSFNYSFKSDYLRFSFSFVYSFCFIFFIYTPMNVFDIYYVMICLDISSLFISFCKILRSSKPDYRHLTDIYNEIVAAKEFLDTTVGFLVFLSVLHNACLIYNGIIFVIYYNNSFSDPVDYFTTLSCMMNVLNFIVKVVSASRISESSLLCKNESQKLYESDYKQVCSYVRLVNNCKEIYMTVWGFVDMKRNIILGTLGAILTYSLLFDNLI